MPGTALREKRVQRGYLNGVNGISWDTIFTRESRTRNSPMLTKEISGRRMILLRWRWDLYRLTCLMSACGTPIEGASVVELAAVAAGGMIGALLRHCISGWVHFSLKSGGFPYGTLTVNMIGCLVIGAAAGWTNGFSDMPQSWRLFLTIGMLGAFTTFSTFGYDTLLLLQNGRYMAAMLNIGIQMGGGVTAVCSGFFLLKLMRGMAA
ncbi:MAG: fluoride efflux transporter CrcB [Chitinivibrionales bacterium]|nr:fluoride efflux transporter CrcB [Chitinivibrionales bacterium]